MIITKNGKQLSTKTYDNYRVVSGTVDNKNPKAVYISISAWGETLTNEEINYTNVWVEINGKGWIEIGSHDEGETLYWNTTDLQQQTCADLRCKAIDFIGRNSYSDYFTKGCCLNITH